MGKTAAIPMDKEIQNFLFIFTGQQYKTKTPHPYSLGCGVCICVGIAVASVVLQRATVLPYSLVVKPKP